MTKPRLRRPNLKDLSSDEAEAVCALLTMLMCEEDSSVVGGTPAALSFPPDWDAERRAMACERLVRRRVFLRQTGEEFDPGGEKIERTPARKAGAEGEAWYTFEPSLFDQGSEASDRYRRALVEAVAPGMSEELKLFLMTAGSLQLCFPVAEHL